MQTLQISVINEPDGILIKFMTLTGKEGSIVYRSKNKKEGTALRVNDRYVSFYYEPDEDIGKIEIIPDKTALLVIDMQNVFVKRPSGENLDPKVRANWERWQPFYDRIDSMVMPNIKKLLDLFREKEIEVIFARITCRKKDGRDRSLDQKTTGFNELMLPPGAPAGEIIKELAPIEDEIVLTKTTDSVLTGTNLRLILYNMGIDTVIATGVFTDQCVSGTVRSLADESFRVYLIEDACMAATEEIQKHELEVLNNIYCHVINTEELLEAIN